MTIRWTHGPPRADSALWLVLIVLVVLAVGGIGFAGYWAMNRTAEDTEEMMLSTAERKPFVHDFIERGEVESSSNIEIRCEVKALNSAGTAIIEVVDEGTNVEAGERLVLLDSSALEQELVQQQIVCNASEAGLIQAQNIVKAAEIAKTEYEKGTYVEEKQTIESEIFVAKENQRRAEEYARYSERLAAKGYVTALQLEGEQFAVEKARNELDTALTKLRVLQEYTQRKKLIELDSDVNTALAQLKSAESSDQLEKDKLKDIKDQITKCDIRAPQAGQVVYANVTHHGRSEFVVEPGATVRERQAIIRLPDPQKMQVKTKITEARITLVKPGMKATIRLDALGGEELAGEVIRVNEYPEPAHWLSSSVKDYATYVKILDPPPGIRPGLTAEVRIDIERLDGQLQVPVQAIHAHGPALYCLVRDGNKWRVQKVEIGSSSDRFVVIESGLSEGEKVSMNPPLFLDEAGLPNLNGKAEKEGEGSSGAKRGRPPQSNRPGRTEPTNDGPKSGGGKRPGQTPPGGRP